jgi:hypothetical protein
VEKLSYISGEILSCLGSLLCRFEHFTDLRMGSNIQYKMSDLVLGGFSLFLLNDSSFLEQQRRLKKQTGVDNYTNLFGGISIPSDASIRDNLDYVRPAEVLDCYGDIYDKLDRMGIFKSYKYGDLGFLVSLDGTQTIESKKVNCGCCNVRVLKNGEKQYYHSCVQAVLSHPEKGEIIPMEPEFIESQISVEKQDCELNASKRWLEKRLDSWTKRLNSPLTFIADDLYAHEPFCRLILGKEQHFIFVCKPESHKCLYAEINLMRTANMLHTHSITAKVGKEFFRYEYKFINQLPIREATSKKDQPLKVNWAEVTVFNAQGKQVYYNSFITDYFISEKNVHNIAMAGRNRWKIENKAFNELKNLGYNITHNFGHGLSNLANTLFALNILAFLFHNFLKLTSIAYNNILKALPKKSDLWRHISVLTQYFVFESWDKLFDNIARAMELNDS